MTHNGYPHADLAPRSAPRSAPTSAPTCAYLLLALEAALLLGVLVIALLAILAVAFGGAADSKVSALIVLKTPHDLLDSTVLEDLPFLSL